MQWFRPTHRTDGALVFARSTNPRPRLLMLLLILTGALLPPTVRQTKAAPAGFVQREGTRFTLHGQPFNIAGANNHYLGWGSREEIDSVLQDAQAMNFNVVRTILHGVIGSRDEHTKPTIWNWRHTADSSNMGTRGVHLLYWDPQTNAMAFNNTADGLARWDYIIYRAGQLNLRLNIALIDFWQWAGGAQQMNSWYGSTDRYTFFFGDTRTKQNYKDWVAHVLRRVNPYTGLAYKDDPTIFAWDLMNEPEISSVTLAQQWISEMSAYVKAIDPHHLVASGTEGFYGGQAGSDPASELAIPTLDFGVWHTYPAYHQLTPSQVGDLIDRHCQTAVQVGKPVVLQEFGYSAAHADQANVYQAWLDRIHGNQGCAGWLVWRLVGKMDGGHYPPDNGEGFDLHHDGGATARVLTEAALRLRARQPETPLSLQPTSTPTLAPTTPMSTPSPTGTPPPTRTFKPTATPIPTQTPRPTSTPIPTQTPRPTSTPIPTRTPKPVGVPSPTATRRRS